MIAWPNCAKGTATATDVLRVRDVAETGAILGSLTPGQVVTVWCVVNGWAEVQTLDGLLTGWASMAYLTPVGELVA